MSVGSFDNFTISKIIPIHEDNLNSSVSFGNYFTNAIKNCIY